MQTQSFARGLLPVVACLAAVVCVFGCGSGGSSAPADTGTPDAPAPPADVVGDGSPSTDTPEPADGAGPDAAGDVDLPPADGATDVAPDVPPSVANLAWAWTDPNLVGQQDPDRVELLHLTDPEGRLTGLYADVTNCLNQPGGVETTQFMMGQEITIALCVFEQTVLPDADGSYLSVLPPEDFKDPDDPFAEVQMYFHVNRVHDYFHDVHGHTGMDRSLQAIVNLQVAVTMFGTAWMSIDNAAYMPEESIDELASMLGVAPPIEADAIVFAQGPGVDMAYDGDVVYHEYTHATIGPDRLLGYRADDFGADAGPLSLHEAHADYFAASMTDDAVIGGWALAQLGAARDLTETRVCPGDVIGESHHDGQVFSSALWEIRTALGAETADAIVFDALMAYTGTTGFDEAAAAVTAQAGLLDPPRDAEVAAIFAAHGLPGCDRVLDLVAGTPSGAVYVPGTATTGIPAFSWRAPGFVQYRFTLDAPTAAVTLTWARAPDTMSQLMSMLGGVPDVVDLELAVKPGDAAIRWTYDSPSGAHSDAVAVVPVVRDGDAYAVTLAGTCLTPGPHVVQFVTTSQMGGAMEALTVTPSDAPPPDGTPVAAYDCP